MVAVDVKRVEDRDAVMVTGGRDVTPRDAVEWARELEQLGAGEILLTSMDRDGTQRGYDLRPHSGGRRGGADSRSSPPAGPASCRTWRMHWRPERTASSPPRFFTSGARRFRKRALTSRTAATRCVHDSCRTCMLASSSIGGAAAPCTRITRAGIEVRQDLRICPGRYRVADASGHGVLVLSASGIRLDLRGVIIESGDSIPAHYSGIGIAAKGRGQHRDHRGHHPRLPLSGCAWTAARGTTSVA